jgi:alanine transaminase
LCVINPGNPTGQVLQRDKMEQLIHFCRENGILLMADEVYQTNIYTKEKPFLSFKKVLNTPTYPNMPKRAPTYPNLPQHTPTYPNMTQYAPTSQVLHDMGPAYSEHLELVSFHSTSKGFFGECGMRGGYMELTGIDPSAQDQLYKLVSVNLCSNLPGQLMTELMVNPPQPGDASHALYEEEWTGIIDSLGRRARKCVEAFNKMEGISVNAPEGAMYLFPTVRLPAKALTEAKARGLPADTFYALELLGATGICVVPGSGFGQKPDTFHFRTTFLPPEDQMDTVIRLYGDFHAKFFDTYR